MDPLLPYQLPVKGLGPGVHTFTFLVDAEFFGAFPAAPVKAGQVQVILTLDKRPNLLDLHFAVDGTVRTECDRCGATIDLPVTAEEQVLVKYSTEDKEPEDADVVYLHPEAPKLDVSGLVYEFVLLAIPLIKTYDCEAEEPRPCDEERLAYLDQQEEPPPEETDNPFREALKNWNNQA